MRLPRLRFRIRTLLVAVAFSAIPMAMIVWIGASREAEAHNVCVNNLKQIGLGLHEYADAYGDAFPYGTIVNDDLPPQRRLSWLVGLWRFIEQLFWILDTSRAWDDDVNRVTRARGVEGEAHVVTRVRVLTCPLTPEREPAPMPALTSYVGITGLGRDSASLPKSDPRAGFFGYDRQTLIGDIRDGLATTMAVAETTERGTWTAGGTHTLRGLDQARRPYIGRGRQFGSNHGGEAIVLFADGSVRSLRDTTNPKVFEALSTIAGGEPLPPEWER
jgi:prepilin-type processing-associated H-X9-DG protein